MHVQVINFHLKGMSDAQFRALCDELAPAFAELPGLIAKLWLADPGSNTYGGVYTWEDRAAMEHFTKTKLFEAVATHPNFAEITSRDFGILEGPTRVTRGYATVPA